MTLPLPDLRVLIVEDNPQAAKLLKKVLGGLGIHQAFLSVDGRQAQQFLDAADDMIDLIICDWEMPNMTGIELLRQVRRVYPNMPFIMVTGNADLDVHVHKLRNRVVIGEPHRLVVAPAAGTHLDDILIQDGVGHLCRA